MYSIKAVVVVNSGTASDKVRHSLEPESDHSEAKIRKILQLYDNVR
jgi:hypothetical protein